MIKESDSLVIRSFTSGDVSDYFKIVSDARVTRFLGDGCAHDYSTAEEYVLTCMRLEIAGGLTRYAVNLKQTGELIGFCGYKQLSGVTDFGFRFAYAFWGQGFATEAGRCVLDFGQTELALHDVTARVIKENVASASVLRKLGFGAWDNPPFIDERHVWFRMAD